MTNAIEQTKREMYEALSYVRPSPLSSMASAFSSFESFFEAHLEELRKEIVAANSATVACAQHSAESFIELENRLAAMTEERDSIQLRLHAIDYAYNEQQRKTGTCGQVCGDHGASEQPDTPDANIMAILGAVIDCQQLVSDWAVYGYRAKKQMKKMAYVLNNNPELRAALDHFEGRS